MNVTLVYQTRSTRTSAKYYQYVTIDTRRIEKIVFVTKKLTSVALVV
jgi:hypothetical protein